MKIMFLPHLYSRNVHLESWSIILGLHAQSDTNSADVQTRRVDRIIMNEQYNRRTKQADIALMHLQQPVNFTSLYLQRPEVLSDPRLALSDFTKVAACVFQNGCSQGVYLLKVRVSQQEQSVSLLDGDEKLREVRHVQYMK